MDIASLVVIFGVGSISERKTKKIYRRPTQTTPECWFGPLAWWMWEVGVASLVVVFGVGAEVAVLAI